MAPNRDSVGRPGNGRWSIPYGKGVAVTLLLIHPAGGLADSAYPPAKTMVMTLEKLEELRARPRAFAAALSSKSPEAWTATEIGALLASHRLDAGSVRTPKATRVDIDGRALDKTPMGRWIDPEWPMA